MILGFQGKLQGKLGCSRVNSRGKLSPIWSIICHYVAHKKPHQANTYPLGLLRWHGGLRCPLCVVCNPPPQPYGELNRRDSISYAWNSIMDSEFESVNRFGFESTSRMPRPASSTLEISKVWLLYATKFSTVALTKCASWKCFEDFEIIFMR